jgi:DNA-binding MarR family transcriptional regulator
VAALPGRASTPPRRLSEREQRAWRAFLATTQSLYDALDRQLQRDAGMPHAYYVLLAMLAEAPDRALRMTDLATVTNSAQSRISHAVARLEEAGWVRRKKCPTDRRGNIAVLTDEGFAALVKATPGHVATVREQLFDALAPEQVEALTAICEAVAAKHVGKPPKTRHR